MTSLKYSIEFFNKFAQERNAELLSTIYNHRLLTFKCKIHNYIWDTRADVVVNQNSWCWWCGKDSIKKYNLDYCIKIAEEKGGWCLSTEYAAINKKMSWKCFNDHIFNMSLTDIKKGSWCQVCSTGISQRICQEYFEQLFKKEFPTVRPSYLEGLELDGYCAELGLAFEHHGEQHYTLNKAFNMTKEKFESLQQRDNKKILLCKDNGITLIIIPQLFIITKINDLKLNIKNQCLNQNFTLPVTYDDTEVILIEAYKNNNSKFYFSRLKELVLKFNGEVLSTGYTNAHVKIKYICKTHNEIFEAIPNNLVLGSWGCKECKIEKQIKTLNKTIANKKL
jgi:hypothetical protein